MHNVKVLSRKQSLIDLPRAFFLSPLSLGLFQSIVSVPMLIFILKHRALAMDSENSTFAIAYWWLRAQVSWSDGQRKEALDGLLRAESFNFQAMGSAYLAVFASRCPYLRSQECLNRWSVAHELSTSGGGGAGGGGGDRRRVTRDASGQATYRLECLMSKAKCLSLNEVNKTRSYFLGLAGGLPFYMKVKRCGQEQHQTLGVFVGWSSGAIDEQVDSGIEVTVRIQAEPGDSWCTQTELLADGTHVIGSESFFAWDGIVRDDSDFFDQNGNMKVIFDVTFKG